jgi:hypothetical protein
MSFDSIYHLHIPRTAGIFIRSNLLSEFSDKVCFADHYLTILDNSFTDAYFVGGHWGRSPIDKMKNPLVFTILRDPIERFISYFNYTKSLFPEMTKDDLLEYWLYDEKMSKAQSNLQFKFLSSNIDVEQYNRSFDNKNRVEKTWFLEDGESLENTIDFIDSIETFILDKENSIADQISNKLNINKFSANVRSNESMGNKEIFSKHYDRIKELNEIDLEIYNYVKAKK